MIRWQPLARATSLLGGNPIYYDLTALERMTACLPSYPPLVRDLETINRALRRRHFGSRPVVQMAFEFKHPGTLNLLARYEVLGDNQLPSPDDFSSSAWTKQDATLSVNDARSPLGPSDADLITDASGGLIGVLFTRAVSSGSLFSHMNKTALFSVFARADAPHVAAIDIRANASPELQVITFFDATPTWRRRTVRNTFDASLGQVRSSWAFITPAPNGTGSIHVYAPDMREIVASPGTDEEILADLYDKLCSDDWLVELAVDGGLTWREVIVQEREMTLIEDKAIGLSVRLVLECVQPISTIPSILDGRW